MKQLTKEQLINLINDTIMRVSMENAENVSKNVIKHTKDSDNLVSMFAGVLVAYGTEIKKECCQIMADTLYDILYRE